MPGRRRAHAGPLKPAIAASIAIPALFRPVSLDGRVPDRRRRLQSAALRPRRGLRPSPSPATWPAARSESPDRPPGLLECVVGAAQISMQSVIREKLQMASAGRAGAARHQRRLHHGFPEDAGDPRDERRLQGRPEAPARARDQHAVRASARVSAGRERSRGEAPPTPSRRYRSKPLAHGGRWARQRSGRRARPPPPLGSAAP